jgi:hypothetical protein
MRVKSTLVVLLFVIAAAANAQQPPVSQGAGGASSGPEAPPVAGKALVYVYRQGSMLGAANYDRIYVNSDYFAALHNSNYAMAEVQPGTVVFAAVPRQILIPGALATGALINSLKKKYEKLRIEVEGGKTYYVKWHLGNMKLVDATTGIKEMTGLHLAKD